MRFFGSSSPESIFGHHPEEYIHAPEVAGAGTPQNPAAQQVPAGPDQEQTGFLLSLLSPEELPGLGNLQLHDRKFVASNLRRLKRNEFEIPLLPDATIRVQQLLATPDARLDDLADVFKHDPTLSAELLRLSNSTYLAYRYPTLDLHQAIIRVGFNQLRGLVMIFSLRSRILRVKHYQREVTWITDLSLAMAKACQMLAQELHMPPEEAFTLGLMHHIEYLVIIGEAARYTVEHRGLAVSRDAIAESVHRVGSQLHSQIARSWGISSFEKYYHATSGDTKSDDDVADVPRRLDRLQRILVEAMSGELSDCEIEGFDGARLRDCVRSVIGAMNGVESPPTGWHETKMRRQDGSVIRQK
jgi:hypothetical protein